MSRIYRKSRLVCVFAIAAALSSTTGCGPTALSSGSSAPNIAVAGWTNGEPPTDLEGNVMVLDVFATW